MKPEELRTVNWVNRKNNQSIPDHCQVGIIDPEDEYFFSYFEPIELTEEWLIKFGHESSFIPDLYEIGKLSFYIDDGICWIDVFGDSIEIKYVHQLQNLYFALTGKELTIKELTE